MSINRDYYLHQARELRRLAERCSNTQDKLELIKLAEKWEELAEQKRKP
ncbi:MAG: hypothetical protein ACYCZX_10745 [Rhodospirillaceae bacterium]